MTRWFQGPGDDDPDLTRPRNVAAFEISASLAHLHDRPLVVDDQPSRVGVALGGRVPDRQMLWRSPWWQGDAPALPYSSATGGPAVIDRVRVAVHLEADGGLFPVVSNHLTGPGSGAERRYCPDTTE